MGINVSSNSSITFESPQSDNALNKKQKDLKWDEQNLQKNEDEKVPRMKIDEPPTPYAELPVELQNDLDFNENAEEIILDGDPLEMNVDKHSESDLDSNDGKKETLDQKQQSLLLGDDEY